MRDPSEFMLLLFSGVFFVMSLQAAKPPEPVGHPFYTQAFAKTAEFKRKPIQPPKYRILKVPHFWHPPAAIYWEAFVKKGPLSPDEIYMSDGEGKLIQIGDLREAKQSDLRREYERILFGRILGCYTIAATTGMKGVEVMDISKSGISFKMDPKGSFYNVGEEVDLRLYFSAKTYLPIRVKVKRADQLDEVGGHGPEEKSKLWLYCCSFDSTLKSYQAIEQLIDFIKVYSENAKQEDGHEKLIQF